MSLRSEYRSRWFRPVVSLQIYGRVRATQFVVLRNLFLGLGIFALLELTVILVRPNNITLNYETSYSWNEWTVSEDVVLLCNFTECQQLPFGRKNLDIDFFEKSGKNATLAGNLCPEVPVTLKGMVEVQLHALPESILKLKYPDVLRGGTWYPKNCVARQKTALIVPYRNRAGHLGIFLNNMHDILQRQQLDYGIFVVEQIGDDIFNKGKLMNAGFLLAKQKGSFNCFIFHDVDLIPENDNNLYRCSELPRHLSVAVDKFRYRSPYINLLGGAVALTEEQFTKVNGYSNSFWGWGGEDDDFDERVRFHGFSVVRYSPAIARYKMLRHTDDVGNPVNAIRWKLLKRSTTRFSSDGLSNLTYRLVGTDVLPLYTKFYIEVGSMPTNEKLLGEEKTSLAEILLSFFF